MTTKAKLIAQIAAKYNEGADLTQPISTSVLADKQATPSSLPSARRMNLDTKSNTEKISSPRKLVPETKSEKKQSPRVLGRPESSALLPPSDMRRKVGPPPLPKKSDTTTVVKKLTNMPTPSPRGSNPTPRGSSVPTVLSSRSKKGIMEVKDEAKKLEEKVADMTQEVVLLNDMITTHEEKIKSLEKTLERKESKIAQLVSDHAEETKRADTLQALFDAAQDQIKELEVNIAAGQQSINDLENELTKKNLKIVQLEGDARLFMTSTQTMIDSLTGISESKDNEIKDLTTQLEAATKQSDAVAEENRSLKETIASLTNDLEAFKIMVDGLNAENTKLRADHPIEEVALILDEPEVVAPEKPLPVETGSLLTRMQDVTDEVMEYPIFVYTVLSCLLQRAKGEKEQGKLRGALNKVVRFMETENLTLICKNLLTRYARILELPADGKRNDIYSSYEKFNREAHEKFTEIKANQEKLQASRKKPAKKTSPPVSDEKREDDKAVVPVETSPSVVEPAQPEVESVTVDTATEQKNLPPVADNAGDESEDDGKKVRALNEEAHKWNIESDPDISGFIGAAHSPKRYEAINICKVILDGRGTGGIDKQYLDFYREIAKKCFTSKPTSKVSIKAPSHEMSKKTTGIIKSLTLTNFVCLKYGPIKTFTERDASSIIIDGFQAQPSESGVWELYYGMDLSEWVRENLPTKESVEDFFENVKEMVGESPKAMTGKKTFKGNRGYLLVAYSIGEWLIKKESHEGKPRGIVVKRKSNPREVTRAVAIFPGDDPVDDSKKTDAVVVADK
jgi:uncharacterized coiled-coil DUF342 family protein